MFIKKFADRKVLNWRPLKGKAFITENDLATVIASGFLKAEKYVFVSFEGLYETAANHDNSNLLVDKVYHTLWLISREYYLLCVSEKNPCLVHVDIYQEKVEKDKMCLNPGVYDLVEMIKISHDGKLYLKNEFI